jgi:polyhydroxyalkanoate synthesis regulator phasin
MSDGVDGSLRAELERLALAAVGAVTLTGERADQLADALSARGSIRRDEARDAIETLVRRWRGDATRVGERAAFALESTFREVGLATRRDFEELELRLAQLEHRLRLLEGAPPPAEPI